MILNQTWTLLPVNDHVFTSRGDATAVRSHELGCRPIDRLPRLLPGMTKPSRRLNPSSRDRSSYRSVGDHVQRASFQPAPDSARAARFFVRDYLSGRVDLDGDRDLIVLLASELATMAIVHSRLAFNVWVDVSATCVRVCVEDLCATQPVPAGRALTSPPAGRAWR